MIKNITIINLRLLSIVALFLLNSCGEDFTPKPPGQIRLEYPVPQYKEFQNNCPFSFEYSTLAIEYKERGDCWYILNYPNMKANIYLTYFPINGKRDLAEKIKDSEKLVDKQTLKASYIAPQDFIFEEEKVYGTLFELGGESAVNLQFHVTDSINNLISGSVYFSVPPNYDSLSPAIDYIKNDVKHLIETIKWK